MLIICAGNVRFEVRTDAGAKGNAFALFLFPETVRNVGGNPEFPTLVSQSGRGFTLLWGTFDLALMHFWN